MTTINKSGVPTRKTKGAIGDVYIDSATGYRYKCIFSYHDMGCSVYEWKLIDKPTITAPKKPVADMKETKKEEPTTEKEDIKPVTANSSNQNNQQRKNYHNQYNKQNNR